MERTRQSSKMHHIVSDGEQRMHSTDRLSSLPDGVICHILSFLPTKISVATSILARKWRFLWAHVSNLDFDNENRLSWTSFSNIINRVMLHHKMQSINTLSLCYDDYDCSEYELETWITTAIERNVQNLDLNLMVMLPQCLFTYKNLVQLTLHNCVGVPSSGVVSLPSLKKLHLLYVEYQVDLAHVLSGCPVLEELIMDDIVNQNWGCLNISSPTIKKLEIFFPTVSSVFNKPDYMVKINAPALRYLQVYACSYEHISVSQITSLIEADIWLNSLPSDFYTRCVLKFLDSLYNVKCLKLSSPSVEFPDLALAGTYVKFDNLTKLELAADWRFLTKFLENADNLEVLIICEVDTAQKNWMEPIEEPCACLLYSLRIVRIDQFGCTEQELDMVRYILRNAQVLKRMEIYSRRHGIGLKAKFDTLQRISLFHRESKECELAFS